MNRDKKESSISWVTIIVVCIIVIIIIIVLIYILTRPSTTMSSLTLPIQQSELSSGTEKLREGSVMYLASPKTGGIKIQVQVSNKNVKGTQITISNQSNPAVSTSGNINIDPLPGVSIDFLTFGKIVMPGKSVQLIGIGNNKFQILSC